MTKLVLYYSPGACSLAAHVALYEMGKPFEARRVTIAKGEHQSPQFLALNPHARVPLLLIDGRPVTELSGILTWIGQQSGLYPPAGTYEAAQCGEWLGWLTSTVHISFALIWRGGRFAENSEVHPELKKRGYAHLRDQFAEIEEKLSRGPYALGAAYSVADSNILFFYRWGSRVGLNMHEYPAWSEHTARLLKRPAVAAALAAEGIDIYQGPDPA